MRVLSSKGRLPGSHGQSPKPSGAVRAAQEICPLFSVLWEALIRPDLYWVQVKLRQNKMVAAVWAEGRDTG